jgi:hypothetical protein
MNLFVGLLIVLGVLWALRGAVRLVIAASRRLAAALRGWKRRATVPALARRNSDWTPSPWAASPDPSPDGLDAWSPAIRRDLGARFHRDPGLLDPLVALELAIAIERREIELARLKAERAGYRQAAKTRRPGRTPAAPAPEEPIRTAADHLAAVRVSAGLRSRSAPETGRQGMLDLDLEPAAPSRTDANAAPPVRH